MNSKLTLFLFLFVLLSSSVFAMSSSDCSELVRGDFTFEGQNFYPIRGDILSNGDTSLKVLSVDWAYDNGDWTYGSYSGVFLSGGIEDLPGQSVFEWDLRNGESWMFYSRLVSDNYIGGHCAASCNWMEERISNCGSIDPHEQFEMTKSKDHSYITKIKSFFSNLFVKKSRDIRPIHTIRSCCIPLLSSPDQGECTDGVDNDMDGRPDSQDSDCEDGTRDGALPHFDGQARCFSSSEENGHGPVVNLCSPNSNSCFYESDDVLNQGDLCTISVMDENSDVHLLHAAYPDACGDFNIDTSWYVVGYDWENVAGDGSDILFSGGESGYPDIFEYVDSDEVSLSCYELNEAYSKLANEVQTLNTNVDLSWAHDWDGESSGHSWHDEGYVDNFCQSGGVGKVCGYCGDGVQNDHETGALNDAWNGLSCDAPNFVVPQDSGRKCYCPVDGIIVEAGDGVCGPGESDHGPDNGCESFEGHNPSGSDNLPCVRGVCMDGSCGTEAYGQGEDTVSPGICVDSDQSDGPGTSCDGTLPYNNNGSPVDGGCTIGDVSIYDCGDGSCSDIENCWNCPEDCEWNFSICGDRGWAYNWYTPDTSDGLDYLHDVDLDSGTNNIHLQIKGKTNWAQQSHWSGHGCHMSWPAGDCPAWITNREAFSVMFPEYCQTYNENHGGWNADTYAIDKYCEDRSSLVSDNENHGGCAWNGNYYYINFITWIFVDESYTKHFSLKVDDDIVIKVFSNLGDTYFNTNEGCSVQSHMKDGTITDQDIYFDLTKGWNVVYVGLMERADAEWAAYEWDGITDIFKNDPHVLSMESDYPMSYAGSTGRSDLNHDFSGLVPVSFVPSAEELRLAKEYESNEISLDEVPLWKQWLYNAGLLPQKNVKVVLPVENREDDLS
jgi:hypothetical protein